MIKNREEVEIGTMMSFCEDMLWYVENDIEDEYENNQFCVGTKELFQGYVIVVWIEADFECKKCKKLNKIIVQHYVIFVTNVGKIEMKLCMMNKSKRNE